MNKIDFHFQSRVFTIPNKRKLKEHIKYIFNTEEKEKELEHLNIIFCSDKFLLKMNRRYLHHDFYTDVIAFDLSENSQDIIGEIYISVDRVNENARSLSLPFINELHRIIYHGILHLCGYTDADQKGKILMGKKENLYLRIF